ncbi:MAG: DUF6951 family protein [Caldicoprobacterales bacterium]|jgi:hypothetical protein
MCNYEFDCKLCGYHIEVKTNYENMQDVTLEISSDCRNLEPVTRIPITLDAMYELMVTPDKSKLAKLIENHPHPRECSFYNGVIDVIGKSLGRYYEIA